MSNIAIQIENITKLYRLYNSHADRVKEVLHPLRKKYHHNFHALNHINSKIYKGETVGILGRNGSGKSTLLQIICGVMQPTTGAIQLKGRIGALLELGTGFDTEYTGRDNIYQNGAILGFSKQKIDERITDIIDFADIGEFIDQPIKMYSTGMMVRLAFAIVSYIDADILVIDEALAVGDEGFQRKCFSKIKSFQEAGKTLLFVSHSPQMIIELCNRAILIDNGEILLDSRPKHVVKQYQRLSNTPPEKIDEIKKSIIDNIPDGYDIEIDHTESSSSSGSEEDHKKNYADDYFDENLISQSQVHYESQGANIKNLHLDTFDGKKVNILSHGMMYKYVYDVEFSKDAYNVRFGSMVKSVSGLELGGIVSNNLNNLIPYIQKGKIVTVKFYFKCLLMPATYFLNAGVTGYYNGEEICLARILDALLFKVQPKTDLLFTGIVDFIHESYSKPEVIFKN